MDKKSVRPVRPAALRAAHTFFSGGYNGQGGSASEDDEEMYGGSRPPPRTSSRRMPKIDFTKLDTASLNRYRKVYKLGGDNAVTKDDLIHLVARHFANTSVDEDETLLKFALALRKQSSNKILGQAPKKPRTAAKPKGR